MRTHTHRSEACRCHFSRVFGRKVARSMCTMSHGLFSQRMESAASRYRGRHVITDSGEPGTSKTCSSCGYFESSTPRWEAARSTTALAVGSAWTETSTGGEAISSLPMARRSASDGMVAGTDRS